MSEYQTIVYSTAEQIATITLNRPDKLNAANDELLEEFVMAIDEAEADDDVRVIIVCGNGRVFCAGADLSQGNGAFTSAQKKDLGNSIYLPDGSVDYSHPGVRDRAGPVSLRLFRCLKPVIAAVHGAAVGVGATMLLAMDVRFAANDTRLGFVFTRRGIVPEGASTWFLQRLVGLTKSLEWCISGRFVSAHEALECGLFKSLHTLDDLLPAAHAYARDIIENTSPVAVGLTKQMILHMAGADHPMEAHRLESRGVFCRAQSEDAKEGVRSFLEKDTPNFPDRISRDMPDYFPWWKEPEYF